MFASKRDRKTSSRPSRSFADSFFLVAIALCKFKYSLKFETLSILAQPFAYLVESQIIHVSQRRFSTKGIAMKFICLGYIGEGTFTGLSEAEGERMMTDCFDYDDELRRGGHFIQGEALQSARNSVTLRIKNGAVDVTDGPYAETNETLGGILLLEAHDLNHAIALMSQHPGVKAGPFEIRPADAEINAQIADRDAKFANGKFSEDHVSSCVDSCGDDATDLMLDVFSDHLTWLAASVADIPDERFAEQPSEVVNHPAWTLSHLNASIGFLLGLLDETKGVSSDEENKQFGNGSIPVTDRSLYASKTELLETLRLRHELVDSAVRAKHAEYFVRATPENLREFAPTIGRIAIYLLASHESYHLGQLMQWRRAAGFKKEENS